MNCQNCGAPMDYDQESGIICCPYCGSKIFQKEPLSTINIRELVHLFDNGKMSLNEIRRICGLADVGGNGAIKRCIDEVYKL